MTADSFVNCLNIAVILGRHIEKHKIAILAKFCKIFASTYMNAGSCRPKIAIYYFLSMVPAGFFDIEFTKLELIAVVDQGDYSGR